MPQTAASVRFAQQLLSCPRSPRLASSARNVHIDTPRLPQSPGLFSPRLAGSPRSYFDIAFNGVERAASPAAPTSGMSGLGSGKGLGLMLNMPSPIIGSQLLGRQGSNASSVFSDVSTLQPDCTPRMKPGTPWPRFESPRVPRTAADFHGESSKTVRFDVPPSPALRQKTRTRLAGTPYPLRVSNESSYFDVAPSASPARKGQLTPYPRSVENMKGSPVQSRRKVHTPYPQEASSYFSPAFQDTQKRMSRLRL